MAHARVQPPRITGGVYRGRKLPVFKGSTRPTQSKVREAIFNMWTVDGDTVVDVFAGTGILGLEALSRGAKSVWWVEKDFRVCDELTRAVDSIQPGWSERVIRADVLRNRHWLQSIPHGEEGLILLLDPPYELVSTKPFARLVDDLVEDPQVKRVLIEHQKDEPADAVHWAQGSLRHYGRTALWLWRREAVTD